MVEPWTIPGRGPIPARLLGLADLAYNLRWSWHAPSARVLRSVDPELWEATERNPVRLLTMVADERLQALIEDEVFVAQLDAVCDDLAGYRLASNSYGAGALPGRIAYFSPEFAITEALQIYSGGLGVLAGDHLKTASDLGVPLIGVGLLYSQGYFRQSLDEGGWQQERYEATEPDTLPIRPAGREDGSPVILRVDLAGSQTTIRVWRAEVGRVPLLLLDANVAENSPESRAVTDRLYRSEMEHRLRQEIILGVGGCLALEALNIRTEVFHLNEGHAGFLALERIRRLVVEDGLAFSDAVEAAKPGLIFTTHTPVPAGIDVFTRDLMERYFSSFADQCGISFGELMAVGQPDSSDEQASFNMAAMALRLSGAANGVSRLHGGVARRMFAHLWRDVPVDRVPITSVTNGVHAPTWVGSEMTALFDRYLGPGWPDAETWPAGWTAQIPDEELWAVRQEVRAVLVCYVRARVRGRLLRGGGADLDQIDRLFDPAALTIGFARRFAEYKRAALILRDPGRLAALLGSSIRPVQLVFAGKAHPRDDGGKELIRLVVGLSLNPQLRPRLAFLEDYDVSVARALYQGVDVWLNTPRRPLEACGTSGMKAALGGAINVSILDGWWDEMYNGANGWAIGGRDDYSDPWHQDQTDADGLYQLLENEIVPSFYDRDEHGLPRRWLARLKASLETLGPEVRASRMMRDYVDNLYAPAIRHSGRLALEP